MGHLFSPMRRYVTYLQPSFKLMEESPNDSAVIKCYSPPHTSCDRVMEHKVVSVEAKGKLNEGRASRDPVVLLNWLQSAGPDRFNRTHLRNLQSRVQQWRGIMAGKLVYSAADTTLSEVDVLLELALVEGNPTW